MNEPRVLLIELSQKFRERGVCVEVPPYGSTCLASKGQVSCVFHFRGSEVVAVCHLLHNKTLVHCRQLHWPLVAKPRHYIHQACIRLIGTKTAVICHHIQSRPSVHQLDDSVSAQVSEGLTMVADSTLYCMHLQGSTALKAPLKLCRSHLLQHARQSHARGVKHMVLTPHNVVVNCQGYQLAKGEPLCSS